MEQHSSLYDTTSEENLGVLRLVTIATSFLKSVYAIMACARLCTRKKCSVPIKMSVSITNTDGVVTVFDSTLQMKLSDMLLSVEKTPLHELCIIESVDAKMVTVIKKIKSFGHHLIDAATNGNTLRKIEPGETAYSTQPVQPSG